MATPANRRKLSIVALAAFSLSHAACHLNANCGFQRPNARSQLSSSPVHQSFVFLLFVAVMILLVRNVLKLYADQRSRVMGTRLRTRMLWGALLVSLIPIASMYAFSYLLLNRAVDRWFGQPVTEMRDDSNEMARKLSNYTSANARAEADSIASSLPAATPPAKAPAAPPLHAATPRSLTGRSTRRPTAPLHNAALSASRQRREAIYHGSTSA